MKDNTLLPLNLQLFASKDEADQDANNKLGDDSKDENKATGADADEKPEEKTFKQEDVNNIAARESKKATEKLLKDLGIEDFDNAKDGMAKFRKWQESQKTEQEKQDELLKGLEKDKATLAIENSTLKAQVAAMKQGVKGESVEDVVALADRLVSDEVDIDQAIKQVIEKYPHFTTEEVNEEEDEGKPKFTTKQTNTPTDNDPFKAKLAKYK